MKLQPWLFVLSVLLSAGVASPVRGDSGHEHGKEQAPRHDTPGSLAERWVALIHTRDAIARDLLEGRLEGIHEKAEKLPALANSLLEHPTSVDPAKLARLRGAVKQIPKVADALHEAADGGDKERTKRELKRLNGLLQLIQAQYPEADLEPMTPSGLVHEPPRATISLRALDMKFEPRTVEIEAGVPTRIDLENVGAMEHSLVVKAPDGENDWIHLHAKAGASDAGTYRLDRPGRYPIACTIPGHTEAGMVGELVVRPPRRSHKGSSHTHE